MIKLRMGLFYACIFFSTVLYAQNLTSFTTRLQAGKNCYLSLKNKKVYAAGEAVAVKNDIDLGLFSTLSDKQETLEWYNLKKDNDKVPAEMTGTSTAVVAIGFDRDQFDKCRTTADLRRTTGYLTRNSFSHFAVIKNNENSYQRCFILEKADGKRALLFVTIGAGNEVTADIKME